MCTSNKKWSTDELYKWAHIHSSSQPALPNAFFVISTVLTLAHDDKQKQYDIYSTRIIEWAVLPAGI